MNKKLLFSMLVIAALPFGNASEYISRQTNEKTADKDLSFLVTFDGKGVNADFAKGDKFSTTMKNEGLMLRGLIGFDDRMSVIEGTWTTPALAIPSGPMLTGKNGSIICTGVAGANPNLVAYDLSGNELEIPEVDLGRAYKNLPEHIMNRARTGEPLQKMVTLEENMKVLKILDTVVKAAKSGKTENI